MGYRSPRGPERVCGKRQERTPWSGTRATRRPSRAFGPDDPWRFHSGAMRPGHFPIRVRRLETTVQVLVMLFSGGKPHSVICGGRRARSPWLSEPGHFGVPPIQEQLCSDPGSDELSLDREKYLAEYSKRFKEMFGQFDCPPGKNPRPWATQCFFSPEPGKSECRPQLWTSTGEVWCACRVGPDGGRISSMARLPGKII